jgi:hypothetical protein
MAGSAVTTPDLETRILLSIVGGQQAEIQELRGQINELEDQ